MAEILTGEQERKLIVKYGACIRRARGHDKGMYTVICQGCGKEIRSDEDLTEVQAVVTKRHDGYFYHDRCFGKIHEMKIQYSRR